MSARKLLLSLFPQVQYSWLWKLANVTQSPYSYVWSNDTRLPELVNGPPRRTMYVTALYFTMTCMTSVCCIYCTPYSIGLFFNKIYLEKLFFQVGFGNVAAETDNEKVFTILMMVVAGEYLFRKFRHFYCAEK